MNLSLIKQLRKISAMTKLVLAWLIIITVVTNAPLNIYAAVGQTAQILPYGESIDLGYPEENKPSQENGESNDEPSNGIYSPEDNTQYSVEPDYQTEPPNENVYVSDEKDDTYLCEDECPEEIIIPKAMYESVMPLANIFVSSWTDIAVAVQNSLAGEATTIIITENILADTAITIPAGHEIAIHSDAGNTFTITQQNIGQRHFIINGGTLTLENIVLCGDADVTLAYRGGVRINSGQLSMLQGSAIVNNRANIGGGVSISSNGHFVMHNGSLLYNNHATTRGAGILMEGGTFVMNAGAVIGYNHVATATGGNLTGGGGIFMHDGLFTMNGGIISRNTAFWGGGVRLSGAHPVMIMHDGEICYNEAESGAGISIRTGAVNMHSGDIHNNVAAVRGGGISMHEANAGQTRQFNMLPAGGGSGTIRQIRDNTASLGGGIFFSGGGSAAIFGSNILMEGTPETTRIAGNSADTGAGAWIGGVRLDMSINGGAIYGNTATGNGGGVHLSGGSVSPELMATITMNGTPATTRIENNSAASGGGIHLLGNTAVIMNGGIFYNNSAAENGGGIHLQQPGTFIMNGTAATTRIENNSAEVHGGGMLIAGPTSRFDMFGGAIYDNSATMFGGGIRVEANFNNNHFNLHPGARIENNKALSGGGVFFAPRPVVSNFNLSGTIHNNQALAGGGGIQTNNNVNLILTGTAEVTNNFAAYNGGGLEVIGTSNLVVDGALINNNSAESYGGGIKLHSNASMTMSDGSITNNYAGYDGGGIFTAIYDYRRIVATGAFSNVMTSEDAVFSGNTTGNGSFPPPNNWDITSIQGSGTSPALEEHRIHQLNNYDINFRRNMLTVTYIATEHGTFDLSGDSATRTEVFDIDVDMLPPFFPQQVPAVTPVPGYIFIGWIVYGDVSEVLLSSSEVSGFAIIHNTTFIAQFESRLLKVYFDLNGGVGDDTTLTDVLWTQSNLLPAPPTRVGWTFIGWNVVYGGNVTGVTNAHEYRDLASGYDTPYIVLQAQWTQNKNTGGNPGTDEENTENSDGSPENGGDSTATPDTVLTFHQSNAQHMLHTSDIIGYTPTSLFSPYHHAYLIGNDLGLIMPNASITRAEVATIFFRLISDEYRAQVWSQENNFSDVRADSWYNNAISTMTNAGILQGMPDGTFQQDRAITRAELALVATRFFDDLPMEGSNMFADIEGHWAMAEINAAARMGWLVGLPDGSFAPDRPITRAEVTAFINRIMQRLPETENDLLPDMVKWPDNMDTRAWFYLYMQEATNSSYFEMKEDGIHKTWIELMQPRRWYLLERRDSLPWDIR